MEHAGEWALVAVGVLTIAAMLFGFWQNFKQARNSEDQALRMKMWEEYKAAQKAHIDALYELHRTDAAKLTDLEIKLAKEHYDKPEVNSIVADIKDTLQRGFDGMGERFDALARVFTDHITLENKRGQ